MMKVPVTPRALIQRINRKLGPDQAVRAARGEAVQALGAFYVLDRRRDRAARTHIDLEELGRQLGALEPWEVLREGAEEVG